MNFKLPDMYLAKNISYLRKKRKLSQEQLGTMLDKDNTTIGKWENNVNLPQITDTFKLAIIFDVDWRDLILTDLSIEKNDYDKQIENIEKNNGIKIIIDKNAPLTAQSVLDTQKVLSEILEKQQKK